MNQSGGIEGPSPKIQGVSHNLGDVGGGEDANIMRTPIHSLDQLKSVLVQHYGEKDGMKLYNGFMMSFAMMMLSQVQHSAEQAKKASASMRTDVSA